MMLTWSAHKVNPLAMVTLTKHYDEFLPTIRKYQPDAMEETTLIVSGTYPSREIALGLIGKWWDKALSEQRSK